MMGEIVQVWLVTDDEWRAIAARITAARRAAAQQR
jgi:CYTH domain-containing protein